MVAVAQGSGRPRLGGLGQPRLADRGEVQAAGAAEQPQIPHLGGPLGAGVAIGETDTVGGEAGEAAVVPVAGRVEAGQVELQDRAGTRGPQLVDVAAHVAGRGPHLLFDPAPDGIDQLQADQLGQAPQAEDTMVHRLAGPRCPRLELAAPGASRVVPEPIVQLAQPDPLMSSSQIAGGGQAGTEAGQRPGPGEELPESHPATSLFPPGRVVGVAQLPRSRGRAGTGLAGLTGDGTGLLRHPAALEAGPVACQPPLQVIAAGAIEAAPVSVAQRVNPAANIAAARHRAGAIPGEAALGVGDQQQPLGVPLAGQPAVLDQRGDPLSPPVSRRRDAPAGQPAPAAAAAAPCRLTGPLPRPGRCGPQRPACRPSGNAGTRLSRPPSHAPEAP